MEDAGCKLAIPVKEFKADESDELSVLEILEPTETLPETMIGYLY
jgi:hypothetical protein